MSHQPFHLVDQSPWPLLASINAMSLTIMITYFIKSNNFLMLMMVMTSTSLIVFQWWRDVTRESTYQGWHSLKVTSGLKVGMMLFILSEVMFFLSFFWTFFHSSLAPNIQIGSNWPPSGIFAFNPFLVPLLNTTILVSSGITVTWAHNSLLNSNWTKFNKAMFLTIILGLYFSILQMWEYNQASFSISDSIYGSIFFVATGFHGLHVIIGTTFLSLILIRSFMLQFSSYHHFGFEAAAWYWHFVDIVWLFLYISIYWWGN